MRGEMAGDFDSTAGYRQLQGDREKWMIPWEEKAEELGLDELCMSALNAVPSERAHQILNDIHQKAGEIRNLSAYVNGAARQHRWDEKEILRRALETDVWKELLDDSAKAELKNTDPAFALSVLKDVRALGGNVRNHSSYVCSTLRKRVAEGKGYSSGGKGESMQSWGSQSYSGGKGSSQQSGSQQAWGSQSSESQQQVMILEPQPQSGGGSSGSPPVFMARPMPGMGGMQMGMTSMGPMAMVPMAMLPFMQQAFMQQAFATQMMSGAIASQQAFSQMASSAPSGCGGGQSSSSYRTPPTPPPKPREASQIDKLEIDGVVAELAPDLDEKAVERVYQLGNASEARKALEVLVSMGDEVRNKSAFINGIVNKRLQSGDFQETEQDEEKEAERLLEFEEQLDAFKEDLDETAMLALKDVQAQMGSTAGLQLLKDLAMKKDMGGIRNLSGFAYKMARTRLQQSQQQAAPITMFASPAQMQENELLGEFRSQMTKWNQDLDERAQKIMGDLQIRAGTAVALDVLKELDVKVQKGELRNISSFVYSMARQRIQGTPMPDKKGPLPTAFAAMVMPDQGPTPRNIREAYMPVMGRSKVDGPTASLPWIQEKMEQYGLKGQLDEVCIQHMLTAQQARIVEILDDISDIGNVRNPAAFIQKSLKDCPDPGIRKRRHSDAAQEHHAWESVKRAHLESTDDPLLKYKDLVSRMDEVAVNKLRGHPDQSRVRDILAEMATKILDIRNPSAFVSRALSDNTKGGSLGPMY